MEMSTSQQKVINRLKRAEGQLRGIQKMIEDEKECMQIMTQLHAVRSSIDRVMGIVVAENLQQCIENPEMDNISQQEKINKAVELIIKK